jgi:hypothetical protein
LETKTEDSIGEVDLEPERLAMFRNFHANCKSVFVITALVAPRRKKGYSHYRCERIFASLGRWLRKNGMPGDSEETGNARKWRATSSRRLEPAPERILSSALWKCSVG